MNALKLVAVILTASGIVATSAGVLAFQTPKAAPDEAEIQLNLGLNIRIPAEYIPEENQRLRMYKRVAGVETESQLADVIGDSLARHVRRPAGNTRSVRRIA